MRVQKRTILYAGIIILTILVLSYFLIDQLFNRNNSNGKYDPLVLEKKVDIQYSKGIDWYKTGNYKQAIEAFKKAIESDPTDDKIYKKIIDASLKSKMIEEAKDYFEGLTEKYPNNSCPHFALGVVLSKNEDYQKAVEHLQKAVRLEPQLADSYANLVNAYKNSGKFNEGIEFINKLLDSNPKNPFAYFGLASAFRQIAKWDSVFNNLEKAMEVDQEFLQAYYLKVLSLRDISKYEESLDAANLALKIAEQKNDLEFQSVFLAEMGGNYYYLGQLENATQFALKALKISREIGNIQREANMVSNLGIFYRSMGEYQKALEFMKQGMELTKDFNNPRDQALGLKNIGDVYAEMGDYKTAILHYENTLDIAIKISDKMLEADSYSGLASVYFYQGGYNNSIISGKNALQIYQGINDISGETTELGNLGTNYIRLGNLAEALKFLKQGLIISREIGDLYNQQMQLGNIGLVYYELGDYNIAKESLSEAQRIANQIEDPSSEAAWIESLGSVYLATGDTSQALYQFNTALEIFNRIGDKRGEAIANANIGTIHILQLNFKDVSQYLDRALFVHKEINNPSGEADTYKCFGNLYYEKQEYQKAIEYYNKALDLANRIHNPKTAWEAKYGLGQTLEKQIKFEEALKYYRQAIDDIEKTRANLVLEEHKSMFFENKLEVYQRLIQLLHLMNQHQPQKNFDDEAFKYVERAKSRALLDILAEANIEITRDIDSTSLKSQDQIFDNIATIQTELFQGNIEKKTRKELEKRLKYEEQQLQELQIRIRSEHPAYANIRYPQPITLSQVRSSMLIQDDVLLEFAPGKESSLLWVISVDSSYIFQLPAQKVIAEKVNAYLSKFEKQPETYKGPVALQQELYDMLLKPAEKVLIKETHLIIIPDGILHYLPFEALVINSDNKNPEYLVEFYDISYAPSASVLATIKNSNDNKKRETMLELLAFGDPVFGDEPDISIDRDIYRERGMEFYRIPYTATEVEKIASTFPTNMSNVFLRADAKEDQFDQLNMSQYSRIHFATHAMIDEQFPGRSCVVLTLDNDPTEDGFLQTNEIFNLKLNSDLVVLSACQTGKGKLLRGEGIIGLSRAFFYAGAKSLVVSLWSVNDQSTAIFMENFYRYMNEGLTKSQALRKTKIDFIHGKVRTFQHPFYWAPFVLQGEN